MCFPVQLYSTMLSDVYAYLFFLQHVLLANILSDMICQAIYFTKKEKKSEEM